MSNRDRNKLIILGTALVLILMSIAFVVGTKIIPISIVVGATLIIQCFILAPSCNKGYCRVYSVEPKVSRYIPIWNEIQILSPITAIGTFIALLLSLCVFGVSKVPLSVIYKISGLHSMVNWGYNCVVVAIIILVIADFILGCGLIGVLRNVNAITSELFDGQISKVEIAYYFLAFIPFLRICYFIALNQKLKTLLDSNLLGEEDNEFEEEDL